MALLIKGGLLVTFLPGSKTPRIRPGDILVKAGKIERIGVGLEAPAGFDILDAENKVILPGFIDTHRHAWLGLTHGLFADHSIMEWLAKGAWGWPLFVDPQDVATSQAVGLWECLEAGTTTVLDQCHVAGGKAHADACFDATLETPIRSFFCYRPLYDPPPFLEAFTPPGYTDPSPHNQRRREAIERWSGRLPSDARVTLGFFFDEAVSQDDDPESGRRELAWARSRGLWPLTSHAAPNLDWFVQRGAMNTGFVIGHGNAYHSAEDLEILKRGGFSIGCAPEDECGMGIGHPMPFACIENGIPVGLSVDCSGINSSDMFGAMRALLTAQRIADAKTLAGQGRTPKHLRARCVDVLRMATIGGAEAIHREREIGCIAEGYKADLITFDMRGPSLVGARSNGNEALINSLVMNGSIASVRDVIVGGVFAKRNGQLVGVDWSSIATRAERAAAAIRQRMEKLDQEKRWDQLVEGFKLSVA